MMHDSYDSDEEIQEIVALHGPGLYEEQGVKKTKVNNVEGLLSCLKTFSKCDLPWVERLDITVAGAKDENAEEDFDPNDDFKREMLFYRQAQAAVLQALPKLKKAGVTTRRPEDFLAQMAKSDAHMVRVRSHLLSKQKEMENREKAKKLREMRKRGKKIQQEVLAQRQKEKKDFLQSIKSYKKGKIDDLDEILENKSAPKKKTDESKNPKKNGFNQKRHFKNAKYGYGGQKKRGKRNDKDSASGGELIDFRKQNKGAKSKRLKSAAGKRGPKGKKFRPSR